MVLDKLVVDKLEVALILEHTVVEVDRKMKDWLLLETLKECEIMYKI